MHRFLFAVALGVLAFSPGWAQVESWSISSALTSKPVIEGLASRLRSGNFETRHKATEMLKKIGRPALPRMRIAQRDPDLEVQMRANLVKQAIFQDSLVTFKLPHSTVEYAQELRKDMEESEDSYENLNPKLRERYEALIRRSDEYVKGEIDADEISYRYQDLTRRFNEASPATLSDSEHQTERDILWFLKTAPVVNRLGLASLLAQSESAQDRQKGIEYLLEALKIAPDIAVSQVNMHKTSFLSIARDLKAADDPEFVRILVKAQGGATALEALQTYFK